jgi:hypothetical protein
MCRQTVMLHAGKKAQHAGSKEGINNAAFTAPCDAHSTPGVAVPGKLKQAHKETPQRVLLLLLLLLLHK